MNTKQIKQLVDKHRFYFNEIVKMWMCDMTNIQTPTVQFNDKTNAIYTDSKKIVIGLKALGKEQFDVKNEDDFLLHVLYFLGHEVQHCRSTPMKTWKNGQELAFIMLCSKIYEKINGTSTIFKTKKDAENFINSLDNNSNYKISKRAVEQVIHFVMNSLEDGRIERIRSNKRKTFKNQMITIRGKEWNKNEVKKDEDNEEILPIILNQILSLSTTSLYQKGFLDIYADTDIEKKVHNLFSYIGKAVISKTNKECMQYGIDICESLADDIIEYCKTSDLEELMQQFINSQSQESTSYIDETSEEQDGNSSSPFGQSDIEIEMTEKEWEKHKNSSNNNNTGDGQSIKIKIVDEDGNDITSQVLDEENNSNNKNKGKNEIEDTQVNAGTNKVHGPAESIDTTGIEEKTKVNNGIGHLTKSGESVNTDGIEEKIIEKMKKAAQEAKGEIEKVKKDSSRTKDPNASLNEDNSEAPDVSDVNENYKGRIHFVEYKREYEVSEQLPGDINMLAEIFKKKTDLYFKNMQTIAIKGKRTGSLDSANVHKLAMKQVNCFYKKAINFEFSGACYILCDNSGSMGYGVGSKRHEACQAMMMIEKAFADKMPLKMVAFDANGDNSVNHIVIKNWHERFRNSAAYNFSSKGPSGCCNKDGYSIRVATSELLKQVAKKKILIVLSDGLPSAYCGDGTNDVSRAVDEARRQGIEVVSIYFPGSYSNDEETFKRMYKYNTITTEPQYITSELIKIMKKFISY